MAAELCGASTAAGTPCKNRAGFKTDHVGVGKCHLHGGCTPTHQRSAQTELARQAVATYGLPREVDPAQALLEEVARTAGHVAWLAAKIAGMDEKDLEWGVTEETVKGATEFPGTDTTSKAVPNIWLVQYQWERKHLAAVSKAALDAGVAARQVALAEQQGAVLAGAISRILGRLDLSEAQRVLVGQVVPEELRAAAGGG